MMMKPAQLAAAALSAACVASLSASTPRFFQATTQADFLRGDIENLSIDNRGELRLGPATELVYETTAPFLWTVVPGSDGSLFIGTGNEGRVFRVDAEGRGTLFFDAPELEAHALALAPDGGLYVGTSPDGSIYKVDRNGTATTFFQTGEKYIWALATDPEGTVYAATGDTGAIYRITPDGEGTKFYEAQATHATTLGFDRSGNLLVGTESPGRVLRVDSDGRGFVLLDSSFEEIRSLHFDDAGMLYVAAVSGSSSVPAAAPQVDDRSSNAPPSDGSRAPVPSVSVEVTSMTVVDNSNGGNASTPAREDLRAPRGAIFRIAPDGLWDQLWESQEDSPYDIAFDAEGRLLIGTGNKGKIYRLEGDPLQATLLADASAQQVTALHNDARGRLYYATANPGKLFRLVSDRADRGTYESEPYDAQTVATWGMISWRGTTQRESGVEVFTRSGNTETPDDNWSTWSSAHTTAEGSPITSPKARYLQWRVVLSGREQTPVVTSISAAYLQRNLRPRVRSVTLHPPGIVFQKPFTSGDPDLAGFEDQTTPERDLTDAAMSPQQRSAPPLGRRTYQKGLQTLAWRADDANGDELSYEIRYRQEGETAWHVLRRDLREPIFVWDTTTVPNGTYFVRVVAWDTIENGPETALAGESDSSAFDVDNSPPQIAVEEVRAEAARTTIAFQVEDDHSPIRRVEHSEDGRQWRAVFPTDGMADSRDERYEVVLDGPLGPRGLSIRATDSMNNVATAHVGPSN